MLSLRQLRPRVHHPGLRHAPRPSRPAQQARPPAHPAPRADALSPQRPPAAGPPTPRGSDCVARRTRRPTPAQASPYGVRTRTSSSEWPMDQHSTARCRAAESAAAQPRPQQMAQRGRQPSIVGRCAPSSGEAAEGSRGLPALLSHRLIEDAVELAPGVWQRPKPRLAAGGTVRQLLPPSPCSTFKHTCEHGGGAG